MLLAELALDAEVVLLHLRRLEIAVDRAELEGLGHVAAERLARGGIDRIGRAIGAGVTCVPSRIL